MKAFLYVVGACDDPDFVTCQVPFHIDKRYCDEDHIFFGPCKIGFREILREVLGATDYRDLPPNEQVLVIGFDGLGGGEKTVRHILWAGITTRLMTFEFAYNHLTHDGWQEMRTLEDSPLHLRPLYSPKGDFIGYRHCSQYHPKPTSSGVPQWINDVCSSDSRNDDLIRRDHDCLYPQPHAIRHQAFDRDCCFLCETVFFAEGKGMPVDDHILGILRRTQPDRQSQVTALAVFGRQSNDAIDGRRGSGLTITDRTITADLLGHIRRNKPEQPPDASEPSRRRSGC